MVHLCVESFKDESGEIWKLIFSPHNKPFTSKLALHDVWCLYPQSKEGKQKQNLPQTYSSLSWAIFPTGWPNTLRCQVCPLHEERWENLPACRGAAAGRARDRVLHTKRRFRLCPVLSARVFGEADLRWSLEIILGAPTKYSMIYLARFLKVICKQATMDCDNGNCVCGRGLCMCVLWVPKHSIGIIEMTAIRHVITLFIYA